MEEDRRTVLGLLIEIHGARSAAPYADDFVVPHLDELKMMMGQTAQPWDSGPYAERARDLLAARAGELEVLFAAYDGLVVRVAARPDRMVITHGEPPAGNVIVTPGGLVMVDWDTALLAAPERDLWDLARHDEPLLHAYAAATGPDIDLDASRGAASRRVLDSARRESSRWRTCERQIACPGRPSVCLASI